MMGRHLDETVKGCLSLFKDEFPKDEPQVVIHQNPISHRNFLRVSFRGFLRDISIDEGFIPDRLIEVLSSILPKKPRRGASRYLNGRQGIALTRLA